MDKLLKLRNLVPRKLTYTRPQFDYFNQPLYLVRSGKELPENVLRFRCKPELTKPEIRQLLIGLYGLEPKSIHTWNKMGEIKKQRILNKYYRRRDHKVVIVEINAQVPGIIQSIG